MSTLKDIESVLNEHHIKFFKGNENTNTKNIFNLPYRLVNDESGHINIYMEFIEDLNIIRFMFIEKANNKIDINSIKSALLDINSSLDFGVLSMKNESDTIEYKIDFQLGENGFTFIQYQYFISRCIRIYEKLKKDGLIL